ncbi:hypothetical protein DXG03_004988 [Asterophora parasitica]|uniref:Uncharacterized protein n=1 Tax=Asterophora parasitica TaxID=117018 RepID=A0A9P7GD89_9AGAR|nr:hypothetical protein DXG03_004988 [Asterophora parasitica]
MGASQSIVTPSSALTAAVVVAGALGVGYAQLSASAASATVNSSPSESSKSKAKAKGGNKKKDSSQQESTPQVNVVHSPAVLPGGFDAEPSVSEILAGEVGVVDSPGTTKKKTKKSKAKKSAQNLSAREVSALTPAPSEPLAPEPVTSVPASKKSKKSKKKASAATLLVPASSTSTVPSSPELSLRHSIISTSGVDTDSSWTRVESRRVRPSVASAGGPAATATATSASEAGEDKEEEEEEEEEAQEIPLVPRPDARRPLAERLLPKPRKTGVAEYVPFPTFNVLADAHDLRPHSMLETPDHPTLARVMRVQPAQGDYVPEPEDRAGDGDDEDAEEGWGVVKSRRSRPSTTSSSTFSSPSNSTSKSTTSAPETLSKRQRQNQLKRDNEKAARAAAEDARLAVLAAHKRTLERERMAEQERRSTGGKGKVLGGGMQAKVDEGGRLVWE